MDASLLHDVRSDSTPTDWAIYDVDGKAGTIKSAGSGSGGVSEMVANLKDDATSFAFLRVGLRFVLIYWLGPSVGPMAKSRFTTQKGLITGFVGQYHLDFLVDSRDEITPAAVNERISRALGRDAGAPGSLRGGPSSSPAKVDTDAAAAAKAKQEADAAAAAKAKQEADAAAAAKAKQEADAAAAAKAKQEADAAAAAKAKQETDAAAAAKAKQEADAAAAAKAKQEADAAAAAKAKQETDAAAAAKAKQEADAAAAARAQLLAGANLGELSAEDEARLVKLVPRMQSVLSRLTAAGVGELSAADLERVISLLPRLESVAARLERVL